jgi:hypothetical protein
MRNRLADCGIRAMLENYQTTQVAWYLTQALGGIKLFVREADAEAAIAVLTVLQTELDSARAAHDRAAAALEEQYILLRDLRQVSRNETIETEPEDGEDRWWEVVDEEEADLIDEEAKAWQPPDVKRPVVQAPPIPVAQIPARTGELDDSEVDNLLLNKREELVLKAFRVAVLGYYFLPLHLYATILILKALCDPRPLQSDLKQKLRWAICLSGIFWLLPGILVLLVLFRG